jgi:hypothetical protein
MPQHLGDRILYVAQAGFELMILLPQPSDHRTGITSVYHTTTPGYSTFFLKVILPV